MNKKEWKIKKNEIINSIKLVDDAKFRLDDLKSKIKRNIPQNCSNKEEIIDFLNDVKQGTTMYFGNKRVLNGNRPKKHKEDLIEILNLITVENNGVLTKLKFPKKWYKTAFKWFLGALLLAFVSALGVFLFNLFIKWMNT